MSNKNYMLEYKISQLIIKELVELKILALQEQKKKLTNSLYGDEKDDILVLDAKSLLELFI